jgi:glycosyltransferase involved in cell wall biosynthesis
VLAQTYKDFEIIVVDDGSRDRTRGVLEPYIARGQIRYIYQENRGIAGARNAGIRAATGDLIAFLDADDKWVPEKLERQVKIFEAHPSIGLIHSNSQRFIDGGSLLPPNRANLTDDEIDLHSGNIFAPFLLRKIYISCLTVMVKRECFNKAGFFDENPILKGFDDFDMWLRILRHYEARYIHAPLALYRIRVNNFSKNTVHMRNAHAYALKKACAQFDLPRELRRKAYNAMRREWGMGQYKISSYLLRKARFIKSKLGLYDVTQKSINSVTMI